MRFIDLACHETYRVACLSPEDLNTLTNLIERLTPYVPVVYRGSLLLTVNGSFVHRTPDQTRMALYDLFQAVQECSSNEAQVGMSVLPRKMKLRWICYKDFIRNPKRLRQFMKLLRPFNPVFDVKPTFCSKDMVEDLIDAAATELLYGVSVSLKPDSFKTKESYLKANALKLLQQMLNTGNKHSAPYYLTLLSLGCTEQTVGGWLVMRIGGTKCTLWYNGKLARIRTIDQTPRKKNT